jgi:putative transposase
VKRLIDHFGLSVRRACRLSQIHRSTFRYEKKDTNDTEIRERIRFLARRYPRYGSPRIRVMLQREGWHVNHKKVERIYREEELSLRRKRKRRIRSEARERPEAPTRANVRWSMDFMSDTIAGGRRFRTFNVIDEFTRESLAIYADTSISGLAATRVLERVGNVRGFPEMIICDNSPEFISKAMDQWCYQKGIKLCFINPGKPIENCFIESFNGRFRDECLNINWFSSRDEARRIIEA